MPYLGDNPSRAADLKGKAPVTDTDVTNSSKMSCACSPPGGEVKHAGDPMEVDGVKVPGTSSQPSSPPDSRSPTPRLTLDLCPVRLLPLVPAPNYGSVVPYTIFRSAFPQAPNIEFVSELGVKSILTLVVKTASCKTYDYFVATCGVKRVILDVEPNKEGQVKTNLDTLCYAILFALNPQNHPVYIHCNQGRHRTGCVVACIRKIQQWPMDEILEEYNTYAHPKPREGDIQLIKDFDPECVHTYGRDHDLLGGFEALLKKFGRARNDSFNSIYELASSLPSHNHASIYSSSHSSIGDDGPILMALARSAGIKAQEAADNMNIDPMLMQQQDPDETVEEVDEDDDSDDSMEAQDGSDDGTGPKYVDGKVVSNSATTSPMAIDSRP